MNPSEILSKAADLIEPEHAWTQGANARGRDGGVTSVSGHFAVCFCAMGSLYRVWDGCSSGYRRAVSYLEGVIGADGDDLSVERWNDDPSRTQSEVVNALRQAASIAKEREGA